MTDTDGGEEDEEALELGTIFTVSSQILLSIIIVLMIVHRLILSPHNRQLKGTSSSTIARTDDRSLRKHHQLREG